MNTRAWFKKWGWYYRPVSAIGWILTLLTLLLIVGVFRVVDSTSHSASDTLIGVFPWAVIFLGLLGWVASHAKKRES